MFDPYTTSEEICHIQNNFKEFYSSGSQKLSILKDTIPLKVHYVRYINILFCFRLSQRRQMAEWIIYWISYLLQISKWMYVYMYPVPCIHQLLGCCCTVAGATVAIIPTNVATCRKACSMFIRTVKWWLLLWISIRNVYSIFHFSPRS